jgi:hypothetical protein
MTIEEKKAIRLVLIGIGIISVLSLILYSISVFDFRTTIDNIIGATIIFAMIGLVYTTSENKE